MDIGIFSLFNLTCLGGLYSLATDLSRESKVLEEFKKAKVYSPSRLLSYFKKQEFRALAKANDENPDEVQIRGFVEGYVKCIEPIKGTIDGKTNLVYSVFYRDEIFSNDSYIQSRGVPDLIKKKHKISAPLYFDLKDPHTPHTCQIHRSLEVDASQALEKIAESRELKPLNMLEKLLMYLGMLLEFFALSTRNTFSFRGIKVGWKENELGITVNSALTAYGDIIFNQKDNKLRIDNPLYFLHEKSNIIKKLNKKILHTKTKIVILAIPFILSSIFLLKKIIAYYKEMMRRKRDEQLDRLRNIKFIQLQDDYKCIICVDRPRNIILKPCLHFSMCSSCYGNLRRKVCPVCKKNINDAIEVFFT